MTSHRWDLVSLIFGVVFLSLGLAFLVPASGEDLARTLVEVVGWGGPLLVVLAGLALILPTFRRRSEPAPEPPVDLETDL